MGRLMTGIALGVAVLAGTSVRAQEGGAGDAALHEQWSEGEKTVFAERSPLSIMSVLTSRLGWPAKMVKDSGMKTDYDLKKESFQLFVPEAYTGDEPYGVFVWISAGPSGALPPSWLEVLAERKVIGIGINDAGNKRETWSRLGLALDAAHNVSKKYKVDPRRVFVSGGSGGGRCASMVAVCFPDAFTGGFYMVGCNSYQVLGPPDSGMVWKPGYVKPGRKMFELATQRSRHVLLTGDGDMNREQTHVYFDGFVKEGFKHITYLEIPKFGHQMPNKEWFAKGLALLEPIEEIALEEPKAKIAKPKPAATRAAPVVSTPVSEADRLLSSAKVYVTNRRYDGARARLKELVEKHPSTAAAEAGRKLLKEIEGK